MKNIKAYEEFSNLGFKERLDRFFNGFEKIVQGYDLPEISNGMEVNNISDIYRFAKSIPSDVVNWCKKVYNENKKDIDRLTLEFKGVSEEICILTLLSIGLIAYFLWKRNGSLGTFKRPYNHPYSRAGQDDPAYRPKLDQSKPYSMMSKSEIQKELDKAIDAGDRDKMEELSKYI